MERGEIGVRWRAKEGPERGGRGRGVVDGVLHTKFFKGDFYEYIYTNISMNK